MDETSSKVASNVIENGRMSIMFMFNVFELMFMFNVLELGIFNVLEVEE